MYTLRIQIFQKRTPAQEQTNKELQEQPTWCISIHRLLAEPDARGFTAQAMANISIHRLLAEPDAPFSRSLRTIFWNFNPQVPRGARLISALLISVSFYFNPQVPRGARPYSSCSINPCLDFNPQAPRGARPLCPPTLHLLRKFQSTGSSRSPTAVEALACAFVSISIHRLLAEPDECDDH